ncbi:MAG: ATP-dependent helicase [Clostridia bacterium]|jgi:DNA helicase-2/ATP-dependent DNA helicase PcrA|nr:ATP-dependent helicase [Clostridia bacterium]
MNLNKEQELAVKHISGPMMVLAGPGTGKTTLILERIKWLILNNIDSSEILGITFSKASATEMKERFSKISDEKIEFATFHSIFYRMLKWERKLIGYNILLEYEKYEIVKQIINKNGLEYEDIDEITNLFLKDLGLLKNSLIAVENFNSINFSKSDFETIYNAYEGVKEEIRKIDFDDILVMCYEMFKGNEYILEKYREKYKYIIIDEFQDINIVQFEIIKMMAGKYKNLFVVGDDDQSIYAFRGARPEIFLRLPKIYENIKKVNLINNYRSSDKIIEAANNLILNNELRYEKELNANFESDTEINLKKYSDANEEAESIVSKIKKIKSLSDVAVIYRNNVQANVLIEHLLDHNIRFNTRDDIANIFNHWVFKDIISYVKLANDKDDVESFKRIINKPNRYMSKSVIMKADYNLKRIYEVQGLKTWQLDRIDELTYNLNKLKKMNMYDAFKYIRKDIGYDNHIKTYCLEKSINSDPLINILDELTELVKSFETIAEIEDYIIKYEKQIKESSKDKQGVTLTTMHSAKGLEFEHVFVISTNEDIVPHEKSYDDIEEERRLFYVSITRAKRNLHISYLNEKFDKKMKKSRFILELKLKPKFSINEKIKHKKFGEGTVKEVDGETVYVVFDRLFLKRPLNIDYCVENDLIQKVGSE